jgi:hypothetical protein
MGSIGHPETSVTNYHSTLHNVPEEQRSQEYESLATLQMSIKILKLVTKPTVRVKHKHEDLSNLADQQYQSLTYNVYVIGSSYSMNWAFCATCITSGRKSVICTVYVCAMTGVCSNETVSYWVMEV